MKVQFFLKLTFLFSLNQDQDDSQIESEKNDKEVLTPKKNHRNSNGERYIETNINSISSNNFDLEFDLDPMFEKNSRQFDGADSKSLLLSKLTVKPTNYNKVICILL